MSRTNSIDSLFFLQLFVGALFILLGIESITNNNSLLGQATAFIDKIFGNKQIEPIVNIVLGVIEIVSGVIILGALILPFQKSVFSFITFIIFALLAIRIVYVYFFGTVHVLPPNASANEIFSWLKQIALDGLVLVSVWAINKRFVSN